jgi:hypothetical protein
VTDQPGTSQPVNPDGENGSVVTPLRHPVVFIALLILAGVFILIGAAILGIDSGVLRGMAEARFARGLITYLFAVVTIGTAVLLIVSALTSGTADADKEKFQRGKEVLSLLLGVFGTIVGFYFGSELGETAQRAMQDLELSSPLVGATEVASGQGTTVTAYVSGGTPPYRYGIAFGEGAQVEYTDLVGADGWIVTEVVAPEVSGDQTVVLKIGVRDATGGVVATDRELEVTGPQGHD